LPEDTYTTGLSSLGNRTELTEETEEKMESHSIEEYWEEEERDSNENRRKDEPVKRLSIAKEVHESIENTPMDTLASKSNEKATETDRNLDHVIEENERDSENEDSDRDSMEVLPSVSIVSSIDTSQPFADHESCQPFEETSEKQGLSIAKAKNKSVFRWGRRSLALASRLCEQLRMVLIATHSPRLRGGFRTGRRIDMRRVLAYIASDFRKDKIWQRRIEPMRRNCHVMLALDDSRSVSAQRQDKPAREALAVISRAICTLEAGQLAIARFGEKPDLLQPFGPPPGDQRVAEVINEFTFRQEKTDIGKLMEMANKVFQEARNAQSSVNQQLLFIVSDGRIDEKTVSKRWILEATSNGIFVVFIILDFFQSNAIKKNPQGLSDSLSKQQQHHQSITDIQSFLVLSNGQVKSKFYLDNFPFPYYIIVRNMNQLPDILADSLRQLRILFSLLCYTDLYFL